MLHALDRPLDRSYVRHEAEIGEELAEENALLGGKDGPKNLALSYEKDTERWTFENQEMRQPLKKRAPVDENVTLQSEST